MKYFIYINLLLFSTLSYAGEWSGVLGLEARMFTESPADSRQHGDNLSVAFEPEYHHESDDGKQLFSFIPFARIDQHDDERSHADIRELAWINVGESWELRLGIRKVFWGVTESQHLVDIINQTDLVENPDGEDKLGQPMINFAWITDSGTFDFYVLPWFRERTFPGIDGRLRTLPHVDTDNPVYESSDKEKHIDYAARWSHSFNIFDMGLSYFNGTSRDPRLLPGVSNTGQPVFVPHYDLIEQTGLDLQATLDNWLLKLEAIYRDADLYDYFASTAGFEYTFYGISKAGADLGLLVEYLYDDRDKAATTPFEDDVLIGTRLTLNDEQSTEFLFGIIKDLDSDGYVVSLEASRRLTSHWKLSVDGRTYQSLGSGDPLAAYSQDDHLQINLEYYF